MNRKFSRMISLFLSLVICFSCVVFADIQEIKCNHIKGEIILELNSDNLGKALLDFAGNKEKDIDMFFYDGPLDFYYQEEQLLEDSKNSFIDLITNELMENKFIKDYALYCYEAGYLEDIDKSILEKELYAELKEDINSDFEEYYASYPYMYKALKDLEYKSVKVVYDVYTYLPEKVSTEIKMTVYILSDDINNNIVVPIHLIVDEEGVLINSDIVLTLYDIISKQENKITKAQIFKTVTAPVVAESTKLSTGFMKELGSFVSASFIFLLKNKAKIKEGKICAINSITPIFCEPKTPPPTAKIINAGPALMQ